MTWYNNKWHNLKHCFELIFLAKIKCLWQIKTICHYFFCNLIDIHTHTQHGLFDNQAGGSGSARSTRLVAMRCALCTSVQALSRVGWCHRCARACAVYVVQERMDEAMTRARALQICWPGWMAAVAAEGKTFHFIHLRHIIHGCLVDLLS